MTRKTKVKKASPATGTLADAVSEPSSSVQAPELGLQQDAKQKSSVLRDSFSSTTHDNFLTYVRTRMDTFEQRPLCTIDSLVFSWLSYARIGASLDDACTPDGILLYELLRAEDFAEMFGTSWDPQGSQDLLFAVCASPRFRNVRMCELRFKTDMGAEEQFAAVTFRLPTGELFIAFRGTDSTIVGWKEDFNMTYLNPVPAQQEAARYLSEVLSDLDGSVYVGGHSKGGNLAVYAAAVCDSLYPGRIARVFSHDGPGFHRSFVDSEQYQGIVSRVEKVMPRASMIGRSLFEAEDIRSTIVESDSFSMLQHNPFLWYVDTAACEFVHADGFSAPSNYFDTTLKAWMDKYPLEDRQRFVDTLFAVISVTGARRFADIAAGGKANLTLLLEATDALDPDVQDFVKEVVISFARTATVERVTDAASGLIGSIKSTLPSSPLPMRAKSDEQELSELSVIK